MKFFIVASLLALAVAEPDHHLTSQGVPHKTPEVKAAEAMHYQAQAFDKSVHFQAKANAEMYKAQMPFVYTHQTPYVYNAVKPVTYTAPVVKAVKPVTYTAPVAYTHSVAAPVTYTHQVAAPLTYTHSVAAPVTYTHPYHHAYPYAPQAYQVPRLHKREAEAEAEADPQVFYNTYGYYPQGYTAPYAPVVYTQPKVEPVEYKKVEKPAVTYTYPFQTAPVTYTAPVVKAVKPVTYTAPLTYTNTVAAPVTYTHQSMMYNNAYPYTYGYPQYQYQY